MRRPKHQLRGSECVGFVFFSIVEGDCVSFDVCNSVFGFHFLFSVNTTLSCRDWKFICSTADSNCVAAEGYSLLILLAEIREAVGDPRARLMQDELVTHVRKIVAAGHEMRRIINIPAASDHTEWATDAEMDEAVKEWENLLSYNVETRHP
jgi:hypothetical protein